MDSSSSSMKSSKMDSPPRSPPPKAPRTPPSTGWSNLPADLVRKIGKKLEDGDDGPNTYTECLRSVCSNWRYAIDPIRIPAIVLPIPAMYQRYLLNPQGQSQFILRVVMHGRKLIGITNGRANILTEQLVRSSLLMKQVTKITTFNFSPDNPGRRIAQIEKCCVLKNGNVFCALFLFRDATIKYINTELNVWLGPNGIVRQPGQPPDVHDNENNCFTSITEHDGRFYAIRDNGVLHVYDAHFQHITLIPPNWFVPSTPNLTHTDYLFTMNGEVHFIMRLSSASQTRLSLYRLNDVGWARVRNFTGNLYLSKEFTLHLSLDDESYVPGLVFTNGEPALSWNAKK